MRLSTFFFIISLLVVTTLHANVTLHDINGQNIPFSTLKGKWVFINYWASWCQPCLDEIPELNRFYETHKHTNVALFAVNYDALPAEMQQQLVKELHIHYPTLKEDPAMALNLGDIRGVPATFVFNPQGELSTVLYGTQTLKSLSRAILA